MTLQGNILHKVGQVKMTLLLIVANVVTFVIPWFCDARFLDSLSQESFLIDWGGNISALTFSGEYWRLLGSQFLHTGWMHLLMNMLALLSIGSVLEPRLPGMMYLAIYLLSGVAGGLLSAVHYSSRTIVSCGASGAIFGLAGATLVCAVAMRKTYGFPVKNLLISLVLTFGAGCFMYLDNMAHLGGLAFGFIAGAFVVVISQCWRPGKPVQWAMFSLLVAGSLVVAGEVYTRYSVPGGQGQIAAMKMINIMESMGLGDSSSEMIGMRELDECLNAEMRSETPNVKVCNRQDLVSNVNIRWIDLSLTRDFEQCLPLVEKLKQSYPNESDRQKLSIVETWCERNKQLYDVVFGNSTARIDVEKLQEANAQIRHIAGSIRIMNDRQYSTYRSVGDYFSASHGEPEEQGNTDIQVPGVFNDITKRVYKAVEAARCPYYTCRKP